MPEKRFVNVVFQGGGVRGIAHAGVLATKPEWCEIRGVGGTSAGALVAALVAIGKGTEDLQKILSSQELFQLLADDEAARTARIKAALQSLLPAIESSMTSGRQGLWKDLTAFGRLVSKAWEFRHLGQDLATVWNMRGLHESKRLREFLDKVLEGQTFQDVKDRGVIEDLRILAADVSTQSYRVFNFERDGGQYIAEAVHASVSIPAFFVPLKSGPLHFVDGGILSNFPSFLFAQSRHPTIGFKLEDVPELMRLEGLAERKRVPKAMASTMDYLMLLLRTMVEAHDKFREPPENFKSYVVETPDSIPSLKFNLTTNEATLLYKSGLASGNKVDWKAGSSAVDLVSFYDPRPSRALGESMEQAKRVLDHYYTEEQFVEKLVNRARFRVRIERDWSAGYEREGELQVWGRQPLVLTRHYTALVINAGHEPGTSSLIDHRPVWEEMTVDPPRRLPMVPCSSGEREKGYLAFYIPPIMEGQQPRRFRSSFSVPHEFERSLGQGKPDKVAYGARQVANQHELLLTFRLEVDSELPPLDVKAAFAPALSRLPEIVANGRAYRCWECQIPTVKVGGVARFEVELTRVEPA